MFDNGGRSLTTTRAASQESSAPSRLSTPQLHSTLDPHTARDSSATHRLYRCTRSYSHSYQSSSYQTQTPLDVSSESSNPPYLTPSCGTKEALTELGFSQPWFFGRDTYYSAIGHNVIPMGFRWVVWGLSLVNLAVVLMFEGGVILGPFRGWVKRVRPQIRLELKK
jgi:hypothetical protein